MSQIRNDIDKLLERCDARYEKGKAALKEENKLMRDRRTRRRAIYLFYVVLVTGIGIYLLCIFLVMFITGLMGMFEDAIAYFGGALIICFVLFALTHIIFFIMRIIIGVPEHQEINDIWMEYYKKLRTILSDADNKDKRFAKVTVTPKYFKPRVEIKAHNDTGVFTEMTITPTTNTPFLKSIYGKGEPSSETQLTCSSVLNNAEDLEMWQKIGAFTEIELPYVQISLFPDILGQEWTYLILQKTPAKDIEDAFDKVCRMVVYDIIRKKLKKGLEKNVEEDDARFTKSDFSPYFTKHDRHMDEELQTGFTKLESMVNHLQAQSNMPYNEEPADGQALPSVEYGTTVCEMTVPTPQQTDV